MPDLEKAYRLLGMANKAGRVSLGMSATMQSIRRRRTHLVLLTEDLSENAANKIRRFAAENKIAIRKSGSKADMGRIFGRIELGIVAVEDRGFADSLQRALS